MFPPASKAGKVISSQEAFFVSVTEYVRNLATHYSDGVFYVEKILSDQLIQALGKVITPNDFVRENDD